LDDWLADEPALAVEDRFKEALSRSRRRDREDGASTTGPHRSDFLVAHQGKDMPARLCSTGEQKALLISIVLAHARLLALEFGIAPVLLLDEVVAHLDADRRTALFEEILALRAQAWMTGTERSAFAELSESAQFMSLRDSRVSEDGRLRPDDANRRSW
jgi:DNA replication and repair protein RecF